MLVVVASNLVVRVTFFVGAQKICVAVIDGRFYLIFYFYYFFKLVKLAALQTHVTGMVTLHDVTLCGWQDDDDNNISIYTYEYAIIVGLGQPVHTVRSVQSKIVQFLIFKR